MNILTFDIEEWAIEKELNGNRKEKYIEFDKILDHILELLDANNQTATFFCLGKIAKSFPYVISKIQAHGHEIGSHSNAHKWVNKMTPQEFRDDTISAIRSLEDVTGSKINSFRAPAFSICESNKWAFDVLYECGIKNDASIFPGVRDFGGFPSFSCQNPCIIEHKGSHLNEFPIPMYKIPLIGKGLAYSGGGYFRLVPLPFVKILMKNNEYNMCYFHIGDLLEEKRKLMTKDEYESYFKEKGSLKNRYLRYLKANIGKGNVLKNLDDLLKSFRFISIQEYLDKCPIINKVLIE